MVKLMLPAWSTSSLSEGETPWAVFSNMRHDCANALAEPLLTQSINELLTTKEPLKLFALAACVLLELMCCSTPLLVNTELLKASEDIPTMAIVTDYRVGVNAVTNAFGYVFRGVFYFNERCPFAALFAWGVAYASSASSPLADAVASLDDDVAVSFENPFRKFL
jgi:hypothetical protein